MNKNLRNSAVRNESAKKPYVTDASYPDMMKQTTDKHARDRGLFSKHSEMKKPYISDDDYQAMEYKYDGPGGRTIPEETGIDRKIPKKDDATVITCVCDGCICPEGLGGVPPFTPTVVGWHCSNGAKGTVMMNSQDQIYMGGIKASDVGAPSAIGRCKECSNCAECSTAAITATTDTMLAGTVQALNVSGIPSGCNCKAYVIYGNGEIRDLGPVSGVSGGNGFVLVTAAMGNKRCTNDMYVTLTCNGKAIDVLPIGVYELETGSQVAYTGGPAECVTDCHDGTWDCASDAHWEAVSYNCAGIKIGRIGVITGCPTCSQHTPVGQCATACGECRGTWCTDNPCTPERIDVRTPEMKEAGCCPGVLIGT